MGVGSRGTLPSCETSVDLIKFDTVEFGSLLLDVTASSDASWISSTGCYGTLRCMQGPCESGEETAEELAARCGEIDQTKDPYPPRAALTIIYPNTGPTLGGSRISLLGSCFGQSLLATGADSALEIIVSVGPFTCSNARIESANRISCMISEGFGAMLSVGLRLGPSKRVIPCAGRCDFHYQPPQILGNTPSITSEGGGRMLTVFGRNFGHPRDTPTLSMRVIVAGQLCLLDKSPVCSSCGYNQDGVVICILPPNSLKLPATVTLQVSTTTEVDHECSKCPFGHTPRGVAPACQCVAQGIGGKVNHMPSWGLVTLFMATSQEAQGGDARRALNETLTRQQLTNLMMLDSSEQILFVQLGFQLDAKGALVQIASKPGDNLDADGLEIVRLQVLASPRNVDAHVTALYGLLAAAADGSLRSFVPAARRVSISQLSAEEKEVKSSQTKPPPPPPPTSGLWVVIAMGVLSAVLPFAVGAYWYAAVQRPARQAQANAKAMNKMSKRRSIPDGKREGPLISGRRFGWGSDSVAKSQMFSSRKSAQT